MTTESHTTTYFGCKVTVFKAEHKEPYPWMFRIEHEGKTHQYCGIPNYCKSKKSALKRAWFRAKWLTEKTYAQHYSVNELLRNATDDNSPDA